MCCHRRPFIDNMTGRVSSGVMEVAERIESTLSAKNFAKSSAVQSPSSHRPPSFSPIILDIVCHGFVAFVVSYLRAPVLLTVDDRAFQGVTKSDVPMYQY